MKHIIDIGFSPCPNDTFIFDALVNRKIDTGNIIFNAVMDDVETLNQWALQGKLPVTKISFGVYPQILQQYELLAGGSALGTGVGPLLISGSIEEDMPENTTVAIPGQHTTAHMLFSLAYPDAKQKVFLRYNEVEQFVLDGKGLGVIIHENRFTYASKGLKKVCDLGEYWEQHTGCPIPLGGIVIKKEIAGEAKAAVEKLIRLSIAYSYEAYPALSPFVKEHAQEMNEEVMKQHIDLYVNDYSVDLGEKGRNAINKLVEVYHKNL